MESNRRAGSRTESPRGDSEAVWLDVALELLSKSVGKHALFPVELTATVGLVRALDLLDLHGWRVVAMVGNSHVVLRS